MFEIERPQSPTPNPVPNPKPNPTRPEVWDEALEGLFEDRSFTWDSELAFRGGSNPRRTKGQTLAWSFVALGLDLLACAGLWLGALFLLRLAKFPLVFSWSNIDLALGAGLALTLLMTYMISFRAFLSFTPGEWACHLQLTPINLKMGYGEYLARVVFRSILVLVTGGIMFPIMFMLFKIDFAEKITGLKVSSTK